MSWSISDVTYLSSSGGTPLLRVTSGSSRGVSPSPPVVTFSYPGTLFPYEQTTSGRGLVPPTPLHFRGSLYLVLFIRLGVRTLQNTQCDFSNPKTHPLSVVVESVRKDDERPDSVVLVISVVGYLFSLVQQMSNFGTLPWWAVFQVIVDWGSIEGLE